MGMIMGHTAPSQLHTHEHRSRGSRHSSGASLGRIFPGALDTVHQWPQWCSVAHVTIMGSEPKMEVGAALLTNRLGPTGCPDSPRGSPPVAQEEYHSIPRSSCHPVIPSSYVKKLAGKKCHLHPALDGLPGHVRAAVARM